VTFTTQRARRWLVASVTVMLCWLISHGTYAGSGDEAHYAMMAHSLAFDRDLDLANNYGNKDNLIHSGALAPENHARPGVDGRLRPVHDVGFPIVMAPYFFPAYLTAESVNDGLSEYWRRRTRLTGGIALRHMLSLGMIALTCWLALQLFELFERTAASPARALLWSAAIALSPPLLSHAYLFFTEIMSATLALWIFRRVRAENATPAVAALAGFVTAYLVLIHIRNVGLFAALVLLAAFEWRRDAGRLLLPFLAAALIPLALRTFVVHRFWGSWITTPLAVTNPEFPLSMIPSEVFMRIAGLLIDQEHGLLPYAPLYLLAPIGWFALRRRTASLAMASLVVVAIALAPILLPFINPYGWRGGWSPAARFLVPVMPFVALWVFAAATTPRYALAANVLLAVQLAVSVYFMAHPMLLWNDGDGISAVLVALGLQGWASALPSIGVR
jgi:hypothetical protein